MKEALFVGCVITLVLGMAGIVFFLSEKGAPTWVCVLAAVVLSIVYALVVTRGAIFANKRRYR